jgi:hypothetical protein
VPEPTVPDAIASPRDPAPPPIPTSGVPDPDRRRIDLAAAGHPDPLDDDACEHLARAGREALDACLSRFTPEQRAAFWQAIGRCYNRPYNPAEETAVTAPAALAPPAEAVGLPAPHVIDAVRPVLDGASPDAARR